MKNRFSMHIQGFITVNKYESAASGEAVPVKNQVIQKMLLSATNLDDVAFRADNQHGKEVRYYPMPVQLRNHPALVAILPSSPNIDEWFIVIQEDANERL